MATIRASAEGWNASLDLQSNFTNANGDPVTSQRARFVVEGNIIYVGEPRAPIPENPNLTFRPGISGLGSLRQFGIPNESDLTPGLFTGYTLRFGYSSQVVDAVFRLSGTLSEIKYTANTETLGSFPYRFTYADSPLISAQASLNAAPLTFIGNVGNDIIAPAAGALTLNDLLYGFGGDDRLDGGDGNDRIEGGVGKDTLLGSGGNDTLRGGSEVDRLEGGAGNDSLDGGTGNDVMIGGIGDDTYFVDSQFDTVVEQSAQGTDIVFSSISFTALGPVENVTLTGLASINASGNALKNTLIGNAGNNTLDGANFDDVLNGGAGQDTLIGGGGFDVFVFTKGEANSDTISDFVGNGAAFGDRIRFEGYGDDATFTRVAGTTWQIADGADVETITIVGAVHPSDYIFA